MDHTIDVKNKHLGRVASEIALILQGKKNVNYNPRLVGNDRVIVKNVVDLKISGRKRTDKIYYRHTGYMGHLKEKTYADMISKNPGFALRHAVRGMLPKNFLKDKRLKRLIIK